MMCEVVGVVVMMMVMSLRADECAPCEGARLGASAVAAITAASAVIADSQREVMKPRGDDVLVVCVVHHL